VLSDRRGLSTAIVTLIITVVGIAVALLVAGFAFGLFGAGSTVAQLSIEKAEISSSTGAVLVQVKDSGNVKLSGVSPTLVGVVSWVPASADLDPGQVVTFTATGSGFTAGTSYTVVVRGTYKAADDIAAQFTIIAGP